MNHSQEKLQEARSLKATPTKTVEEVVWEVIYDNFGISPDDLKTEPMEVKIVEDLGADSLDKIEIVIHLEEEIGFTIEEAFSEEVIQDGTTVADLIVKVADIIQGNSDDIGEVSVSGQ